LLGEAFERLYPQRKIEVPPSIGSTGGIQAVADGAVALGLISRSLKPPEKALGLTSIPYARTAVVIGVHPSVSDDGITFAQLVDIYRGTRTHWQDGRDIIVLTREPGDSSIEILEQVIAGFKEVFAESQQAKRWTTLHRDQEMNQTLTSKPYAIGLSDMGAITAEQLPIKVLKVNGTLPSADNVLNGRYPLVKTLSFVFKQDKLSEGAQAFMDFVRSPAGEQILRTHGYLPGA
jgi:phosphate transport system substrate-binding protein